VLLDVSALECDMRDIQSYLQDKGFEVEKTTPEGTILFLFTIGNSTAKEGELFFALSELEREAKPFDHKVRVATKVKIPDVNTEGLSYFFAPREAQRIEQSVGRVSSFLVTPYPPGIPVLVPGQRITKEHVAYIEQQLKNSRTIHGCDDGLIFVAKEC
jgi:arginine/lysine/ornithine decarboxylase